MSHASSKAIMIHHCGPDWSICKSTGQLRGNVVYESQTMNPNYSGDHFIWSSGQTFQFYLVLIVLSALFCFLTRCGKTTICQLFAALAGHKFFSVNCHLHMETSDFLGGLRPVRHTHQVMMSLCWGQIYTQRRKNSRFWCNNWLFEK